MDTKESEYVIMSSEEFDPLKEEIVDLCLKKYSTNLKKVDIEWKSFPDGFPNLVIKDVKQNQGKHVIFLVSLNRLDTIFHKFGILFALPRYFFRSLTIILPFFPTATMERVVVEGEIATSATLCRLLSAIPLTVCGPAKLVIFDLHELSIRFQIRDNLVPILASGQGYMLNILKERFDFEKERFVFVFPDAGSAKRYCVEYNGFETVYCLKERVGNERKISIKKGVDITQRNVVVIDDLIQSGGTVIECVELLKQSQVKSVGVMVTHPVFPNDSWKRFVDIGLRFFYVCNTVPETTAKIQGVEPFDVISIANPVIELIKKF